MHLARCKAFCSDITSHCPPSSKGRAANLLFDLGGLQIQRLTIYSGMRSGTVGNALGSERIPIRAKITFDDPRRDILIISHGISRTRPFE